MLYSTAKRAQLVESMYLRLHRGESVQTFNIWVYGENGRLVRGSGLRVANDGVTWDHHLVLPKDGTHFCFFPGSYTVALFATLVGSEEPHLLSSTSLTLSEQQSAGKSAARRFIEFFTANIRNKDTRAAYAEAVGQFFQRCEARCIDRLDQIGPVLIAAYIEELQMTRSAPTVKQHRHRSASPYNVHAIRAVLTESTKAGWAQNLLEAARDSIVSPNPSALFWFTTSEVLMAAGKRTVPRYLQEPELDCPVCRRSVHTFVRLDDHMAEHEGLKRCRQCGETIRGPFHRCR